MEKDNVYVLFEEIKNNWKRYIILILLNPISTHIARDFSFSIKIELKLYFPIGITPDT